MRRRREQRRLSSWPRMKASIRNDGKHKRARPCLPATTKPLSLPATMKRAALFCLIPLLFPALLHADTPPCDIKPDVVYGHKMGMALTFDVIKPKTNSNGAGILFMVSGGWISTWMPPEQVVKGGMGKALGFSALLEKGFTLF